MAVDELRSLIGELGSPALEARIGAQSRLMEMRSVTLRMIEEAARSLTLSPEQRQRLLTVAYHRFQAEPRAAMGIQPDFSIGRGVGLQSVVREFPAAEVLRGGDRIISLGGVTVDDWNAVRAVIIARDPGDELPVTVLREGATLNLRVKLGEFSRLRQAGQLDTSTMEAAWEMRSRDMQDPEMRKAKAIDSGLPASVWLQSAIVDSDAVDMAQAMEIGPTPGTGVVAGGEARGGLPAVQAAMLSGGGIRLIQPGDRPLGAPQDIAQVQAQMQLQLVQALRQQTMVQLESVNTRLLDQTLSPQMRAALKARAESLSQELRMREMEVQRLLNQMARPQRP